MQTNTIKNLKISTLVEDTCPKRPFWGEHGLSFWIEADDKNILFDTGQSGEVLMHNLKLLGLELKSLDAFVLSHPHDDHSGGISLIAQQIKDKPVYCVSNAFDEYIPDGKKIEKLMTDIYFVGENREVLPGIFIPKERDTINSPKVTKEINLVINLEGKGLVVIVGCAHHGLLNLINNAKALFEGEYPVYALVGGLHLKDTTEKEIIEIVDSLRSFGLKILAPNHCTSFNALRILAEKFPAQMEFVANSDTGTFYTGQSIEL